MDLLSVANVTAVSLTANSSWTLGREYTVFSTTYGECRAVYVKLNDEVTVAGAPMYPVLASWDVAGLFLVDEDENVGGVIGQEWCAGSWLGGVCATANYGFVQTYGPNLVTITTDNTVEAKDIVCPFTTDGSWYGTDRDELVTDATNDASTRCGFAPAADGGTTMVAGKVFWDVHLAGA